MAREGSRIAGDDRTGIQMISRVGEILRLVSSAPTGMTQSDLSDKLGLSRATTYRTLTSMVQEGLLSSIHGQYRIGPEIGRLSLAAESDFMRDMRPHLEGLSTRVNETAYLTVLDVNRAIVIDRAEGSHELRVVAKRRAGSAASLYCTAGGKALMSEVPKSVVSKLLGGSFEKLTPNTLTTRAAIEAELAEVRKTGIAWDREEAQIGLSALACGFPASPVGPFAVGIMLPTVRLIGREPVLVSELLDAKAVILQQFPGR